MAERRSVGPKIVMYELSEDGRAAQFWRKPDRSDVLTAKIRGRTPQEIDASLRSEIEQITGLKRFVLMNQG